MPEKVGKYPYRGHSRLEKGPLSLPAGTPSARGLFLDTVPHTGAGRNRRVLPIVSMKNKYGDSADLRNEADVEQNFARRLLEDFGYSDSEILPKQSLDSLTVGGMRGHPQRKYKPDFGLRVARKIRWIIEAKAPDENLDSHEWQPRQYCMLLNGRKAGDKPVKYHLLTNGLESRLYDRDLNEPLLKLKFTDFANGNQKFVQLQALVGRLRILEDNEYVGPTIRLEKPPLGEVNAAFSWCHQHIYRKDDISQSDAFTEFVKLIALKLMSDRRIRDRHPEILVNEAIEIPIGEVEFCVHWIELEESSSTSPINDILFKRFMDDMKREIARERRKPIFEDDDFIRLKPETIKGVVRRLEKIFLFGIDADLNGRLFETFLNATMRGKDLGQFFTPRSIVELGVELAKLRVGAGKDGHTDTVIDACCGTGGFLIDALADMWAKAGAKNISDTERSSLKIEIANNHIVGVDVANGPKLARIARLNMYLHGDGGTRIFHLNALDKKIDDHPTDSPEIVKEKREFRKLIGENGFDVALTNPPFAKAYDRSTDEESSLLDHYEVGKEGNALRASVRSALLYAERYRDLLKIGGRLVTVIDDGILSGDDYRWFRDKLREWFLIRAVISLPGDAFQRSNARVKMSYLIAEKRDPESQQAQPPVFMYPCQYVGIDDPKRQRARPGDAEARRLAKEEIKIVVREYDKFLSGDVLDYSVPAVRVADRLDVKNCLMKGGRSIPLWSARGFRTMPLSDALEERIYADDDIIKKDHPEEVRILVVRYEGIAESDGEILPAEGSYSKLYPVHQGDIVISNIAASHGSIAMVPPELDGCVVSNEYTVLQPKAGFDPIVLQLILRSPEVRADILLSSSGANRTRARWDLMQNIVIPYPAPSIIKEVRQLAQEADDAKRRAAAALENAREVAETSLLLRSKDAATILAAFRPPK